MAKQPSQQAISAARRVTLGDVARAAGISKATASLALNGKECIAPETRRLVRETADRLGYEANVLAQNWSRGGCRTTVAFFVSGLDLGVRTQKLQRIQAKVARRGFDVPVYVNGVPGQGESSDQAALMSTIRRQRPRAILCNVDTHTPPEASAADSFLPRTLAEMRRYIDEGGILVCYDSPVPLECDQVVFDREDNTYRGTRYLLEQGHRDIGFCLHGFFDPLGPRLHGFRRAMDEFGAPVRPEWLFFERGYEEAGGRLAEKVLALAERPTAMCVVNDVVASAFINMVRRAGLRVPEDVSVVGHDDSRAAAFCAVPLTSVSHPVDAIAEAVTDLLFRRIEGEGFAEAPARTLVLQGEVAVRESAAPPPARR